jgi:hypothetical protein
MTSAGGFFLIGLVVGAWKYACMFTSPEAKAPYYVDAGHRAALMYAFASALLAELCAHSAWSNAVNLAASIVMVVFFGLPVLGYIVHGALRDTDNQFRRPHQLGARTIAGPAMVTFMATLIIAEIGGFAVIFMGYLVRHG